MCEYDVDVAEETVMSIVHGEQRDWTTRIGPLIRMEDLLALLQINIMGTEGY